jgi:hypothetical protein
VIYWVSQILLFHKLNFCTAATPWVTVGVLLSIFGHTLATVLTSMSTARVGGKEKGTLLGLEHGVFSGVRVVAPTLGMALFKAGLYPVDP